MTKSVLRKKVHEFVDQVDENFLTIVHQLLEREISTHEYEFSDEEIRTITKRKAEMRSGKVKGIPHKTVIANLRAHLKKSSK
jgi:hypothetical protein